MSNNIPESEYSLSNTSALVKQMFWFQHNFSLQPSKLHHGMCIAHTDLVVRDTAFLDELKATIIDWVWSEQKSTSLIEERIKSLGVSMQNSVAYFDNKAKGKFRKNNPQGQFGELLLFNLIQHIFKAVPLLRKMSITTSSGHERFGADAIHYKKEETRETLILGESKCYKSKYRFKQAFEDSLTSIVGTIEKLDQEMSLYMYDDFIEESLKEVANRYKNNEMDEVRMELVCIIIYNETQKINFDGKEGIKAELEKIIKKKCSTIDKKLYAPVTNYLGRMNYIIFPVWNLDKVLENFEG